MEVTLEAGAEDIQDSGDAWEVFTAVSTHQAVVAALKTAGIEPDDSQIAQFPDTHVALSGGEAQKMLKLMELLEDQDDVQNVWANFDIPDKELEAAANAG